MLQRSVLSCFDPLFNTTAFDRPSYFCAELAIQLMLKVGASKIAACVTDNASNMVAARNRAEQHPQLSHVVFLRCFMHAFSLVIGSILGHAHAKDIVSKASRIVTFFRASHRPGEALQSVAKQLGIKSCLQRANATRFTSVFSCLSSVHNLEQPLRSVVEADNTKPQDEKVFPKKVQGVCRS